MKKNILFWGLLLASLPALAQAIIANPQNTDKEGGEVVLMNSSIAYNQWNIDNYAGNLRFFHNGVIYSNLSPSGDFNVAKNIFAQGNIGIGLSNPATKLVVGSNFGANISGTTGGNSMFGSNLGYIQGGIDHNKLVTPSTHTNNYGYSGMRSSWGELFFYTSSGNTIAGQIVNPEPRLFINKYGNIGIGTTTPDSKFTVKGNIHAEEVKVDLSVPGPDYVFASDYDLPSLKELQKYISENRHLPNIPSAAEMEANGIELGIMNMKLLEKIEELVLYTLEQENKINNIQNQNMINISLLNEQFKKLESLVKNQQKKIESLKQNPDE